MNKTKNFVWIITVIALIGLSFVLYKKLSSNTSLQTSEPSFETDDDFKSGQFSDGLTNPDSETKYSLNEFDTGVAEKSIYYKDINHDNLPDRITKEFIETGNAHSYYKYKIELNKQGKYVDITPKGLQTTNGADCDLQQIQFKFKPKFQIIVIYREMGDTWNENTMAHKKTFSFDGQKLTESASKELRPICDVKELF